MSDEGLSGARMTKAMQRRRAALDAVARHFSASLRTTERAAHLTLAGKRIALHVATLATLATQPAGAAKPRLRFDRVVLRLVADVQAGLADAVPDGTALIFTVTAPIRLPAKTAEALIAHGRDAAARRAAKAGIAQTLHGNRVRLRRVTGLSAQAPKVLGFVHNPDCDAAPILEMARALLTAIHAAGDARPPHRARAAARWLILLTDDDNDSRAIEPYRQICAPLAVGGPFARILLVSADGRIAPLAPRPA